MYSDGDPGQLSRWQLNRSGTGGAPANTPVSIPDVTIGTSASPVYLSGSTVTMYSTGNTTETAGNSMRISGLHTNVGGSLSCSVSGGTLSLTSISGTTITGGLSGTTNKPIYTTAQLAGIISGATSFSGLAATLLAL